MFILSFGVKDEIMVLDAAVLLFNLSSAAGGQYKSGVHLLILMKPVSLKSKKRPVFPSKCKLVPIRNTVSSSPLCSETGF